MEGAQDSTLRKRIGDVRTCLLAQYLLRRESSRTDNEAPRPAPPPPRFARCASSSGPPPPLRGGGWREQSRSRGAFFAPELCQSHSKLNFRTLIFVRRHRWWHRLPSRSSSASQERKKEIKGSGTPKDAGPQPPHLAMRRAPCKARSPSGVPPRLSPKGIIPSQRLSFRPGFLGLGLYGRYPPSPVPVQGCTSHPGHNAGRLMPKPPGSASDEPPPAGTALAPISRRHRLTSFK